MASGKRAPATVEEVIDALTSPEGRGPRLEELNAVPWALAIESVRDGLKTTRQRAGEWLMAAVEVPDGPLVAMWAQGACQLMTGSGRRGAPLDWPVEVQAAFKFNPHTGQRCAVDDTRPYSSRPWVMRRSALPILRDAIERELAEREQTVALKLAEEKRALEAWFAEHHGPAHDTIRAFVDSIHGPGTPPYQRDRILRISDFDMSELFGTPGTLTIELYGDTIERFAEAVRLHRLAAVFSTALGGGDDRRPTPDLMAALAAMTQEERDRITAAAFAVGIAARDRTAMAGTSPNLTQGGGNLV